MTHLIFYALVLKLFVDYFIFKIVFFTFHYFVIFIIIILLMLCVFFTNYFVLEMFFSLFCCLGLLLSYVVVMTIRKDGWVLILNW